LPYNPYPADLRLQLRSVLQGKVMILGVGNRLRGDDGAGSHLIERLAGKVSFAHADGGVAPENHLEKIVAERPDSLLIVDTADFSGRPGAYALFDPLDLLAGGLSTHSLSLGMLYDYLKARLQVKIWLLAIQPETIGLQEGLSARISEAVDVIAKALMELFPVG